MTYAETWLDRLSTLIARFPEYGAGADLTSLSKDDCWGLYRFLDALEAEPPHPPRYTELLDG